MRLTCKMAVKRTNKPINVRLNQMFVKKPAECFANRIILHSFVSKVARTLSCTKALQTTLVEVSEAPLKSRIYPHRY